MPVNNKNTLISILRDQVRVRTGLELDFRFSGEVLQLLQTDSHQKSMFVHTVRASSGIYYLLLLY